MGYPRIMKKFKSFKQFEEKAKHYFELRPLLSQYNPREMGIILKTTPEQLGMITIFYNKTSGDISQTLEIAKNKVLGYEGN